MQSEERSLLALETVVRPVAVDEPPLVGEPLFGRVDRRQDARIVGRKEAHERHHQVRRVELVGSERLRERVARVAPAIGQDGVVDLAPHALPVVDAIARVEPVGQRDRAFERDPTHELRVHEVARFAAHLPDSLVAFGPPPRRRVGQVHEERLRGRRQVGELVGEAIDAC